MKKSKIVIFIILIIAVAAGMVGYLNRQWLQDWYAGLSYAPSEEMAGVQEKLNLTGRGEFLFRAARPELNERQEFNQNCVAHDAEVAVLGCYTEDIIYVYHITEQELDGIIETTTAHELLHAVFKRTSEDEKEKLEGSLQKVLTENKNILQREIESYPEEEQLEELYVRAGTEVKSLPEDLEKHYAEIFEDQDGVVSFYEQYIKVFRDLEAELNKLEEEIGPMGEQLQKDLQKYEKDLAQLNADIVSFNACAEVSGCFKSTREFYNKRNTIVATQKNLNKKYDELNRRIEQYNAKIETYNNDVLRGQNLNRIINSNSRPNEI